MAAPPAVSPARPTLSNANGSHDVNDTSAFHLSPAQRQLLDETSQFARDHLLPIVQEGEAGRVNPKLLSALGDHGLFESLFKRPRADVDRTLDVTTLCLTREALAAVSPSAETAYALQGLGGYPILALGTAELRERLSPQVRSGSAVVAFALSESDAGSDVSRLSLRAERVDGGYVLNGAKKWISNAPGAHFYSLFARTSDGTPRESMTAFAVDALADGLNGRSLDLIDGHPIGELLLTDVFVPHSHVLGAEGQGFAIAMDTLRLFRPSVGAFAVGMAQAALDLAVERCRGREVFGRPLGGMQAVAHRLADLWTQLEAARLLVYQAAAEADSSLAPPRVSSAMAKLFATETAQQVIDFAVQLHGAEALESTHQLSHFYRVVRATRIYEGASEVQREIIARTLLGRLTA